MKIDHTVSINDANTLELHYILNDNTHSMDAFIHNKCESEFLAILKEIAASFGSEIIIETEPLGNGGLKRIFKVISKNEAKNATITIALITVLAGSIIGTTLTTSISKIVEIAFEDKELKQLEKEKLKLEIEKLRKETRFEDNILSKSHSINIHKSNFYVLLNSYQKVSGVSFTLQNEEKVPLEEENIIKRENFKDYILKDDFLEPKIIKDAEIEIIAPVLKKGELKWRGFFSGEFISFNMKSKEFKELVQSGDIKFQNGSSIKCTLEVKSKLNELGQIKPYEYNILEVVDYFENDNPVEIDQLKKIKKQKELEKLQITVLEMENIKKDSGENE